MKISVENIEMAVKDFAPKRRGVYALLCRDASAFQAIEYAHRFARAVGFEDAAIVTEHFFFQRDCQLDTLHKKLEKFSISAWSRSGAMIVIPGLSKRYFDQNHRTDETEIVAFLFCLRSQLDALEYPIFVPFHTEDLAVSESVLWPGLAVMGFTRVELKMEDTDKSVEAMLFEDALDEAVSMAAFPDTFDWLNDRGE